MVGGSKGLRYIIKGTGVVEHGSDDGALISDRYSAMAMSPEQLQPKCNMTEQAGDVEQGILSVPGQRFASLQQQPLLLTAELEQGSEPSSDVGPALQSYLRLVKTEPLVFDLQLPDDWQGEHSQLLLRLACQPEMANQPLNASSGYLFYRVPLSPR